MLGVNNYDWLQTSMHKSLFGNDLSGNSPDFNSGFKKGNSEFYRKEAMSTSKFTTSNYTNGKNNSKNANALGLSDDKKNQSGYSGGGAA